MSGPDLSFVQIGLATPSARCASTSAWIGCGSGAKQGAGRDGRAERATSTLSAWTITTVVQHGGIEGSAPDSSQHSITSSSQHGAVHVGTPLIPATTTTRTKSDRMERAVCINGKISNESAKRFFLIFGHTIRTEAR